MQRLGRKGHPMYRVVVQDSRRTPTSGKYVALLGSYDPHNKVATITKDKAELYLKNGAQPSDRVVKLFKSEKVSLPKWVKVPAKQKRDIRNPDKLRKNRPDEEKAPEPVAEAPAETEQAEEVKAEGSTATDEASEVAAETKPVETEPKAEEIEKDEEKTKTPPNEDEFPEDKQDEADKPEAPAEKA